MRDRSAAAGNLNGPFHAALLRIEGAGLRDQVEGDLRDLEGVVDGRGVRRSLDEFLACGRGEKVDRLSAVVRLAQRLRSVRVEGV